MCFSDPRIYDGWMLYSYTTFFVYKISSLPYYDCLLHVYITNFSLTFVPFVFNSQSVDFFLGWDMQYCIGMQCYNYFNYCWNTKLSLFLFLYHVLILLIFYQNFIKFILNIFQRVLFFKFVFIISWAQIFLLECILNYIMGVYWKMGFIQRNSI